MKHLKTVVVLSMLISIFAAFAAGMGLFSGGKSVGAEYMFSSIWSENVEIHGSGVYRHESVSVQHKLKHRMVLLYSLGFLYCSVRS